MKPRVLLGVAAILGAVWAVCIAGCQGGRAPEGPYVKYTIKGDAVEVVAAATPFDSNPSARSAFLSWFQRGIETTLKGNPPLMVEWQPTDEGRAGMRGYDAGMQEGEACLKDLGTADRTRRTTRIARLDL